MARDLRPRGDNAGALPRATSRARGFLADASRFAHPADPSRAQRLLDVRVVAGTARPDARDNIRRQSEPDMDLGDGGNLWCRQRQINRACDAMAEKSGALAHIGTPRGRRLCRSP